MNFLSSLDSIGFVLIRVLASVLWQSSLLLIVGVLFALGLRKKSAALSHGFLALSVCLIPLIPAAITLYEHFDTPRVEINVIPQYERQSGPAVPFAVPPMEYEPFSGTDIAPAVTAENHQAESYVEPEQQDESVSILDYPWAIAAIAYGLGAFFFLALTLTGRIRIARWKSHAKVVTDSGLLKVLSEARDRLGLNRTFLVMESDEIAAPMSYGSFHPVILLPAGYAATLSREEMTALAVHEFMHVKRFDPVVFEFVSYVRALFFFNPLIWLASRKIAELAETICDDAAVESIESPVDYAEMLVRLAAQVPERMLATELAAGFLFSRHTLLRRIEQVLADRGAGIKRLSRIAFVTTALSGLLLFLTAMSLPLGMKAGDETDGTIIQEKVDPDSVSDSNGKPVLFNDKHKVGLNTVLSDSTDFPYHNDIVKLMMMSRSVEVDSAYIHEKARRDGYSVEIRDLDGENYYFYRELAQKNGPLIVSAVPVDPGDYVKTKRGLGAGNNSAVFLPSVINQFEKEEISRLIEEKNREKAREESLAVAIGNIAGRTYDINRALYQFAGPRVITDKLWTLEDQQRIQKQFNPSSKSLNGNNVMVVVQGIDEKDTLRLVRTVTVNGDSPDTDTRKNKGAEGNISGDDNGFYVLKARIVDSISGKPVEGVTVCHRDTENLRAVSDNQGQIIIRGLSEKTNHFEMLSDEYARWWSDKAIFLDQRESIPEGNGIQRNFHGLSFYNVSNITSVTIVVEKGVKIKGTVLDPQGRPRAYSIIAPCLTGTGNSITGDIKYSVLSDENGKYEILLPAGGESSYNLMTFDGEYQSWREYANGYTEPFKTEPGQLIENMDISLQIPAVVKGTLRHPDGSPIASRTLIAYPAAMNGNHYFEPTAKTDEDGNFTFKSLSPGNSMVVAARILVNEEWEKRLPEGFVRNVSLKPGDILEGVELVGRPKSGTRLSRTRLENTSFHGEKARKDSLAVAIGDDSGTGNDQLHDQPVDVTEKVSLSEYDVVLIKEKQKQGHNSMLIKADQGAKHKDIIKRMLAARSEQYETINDADKGKEPETPSGMHQEQTSKVKNNSLNRAASASQFPPVTVRSVSTASMSDADREKEEQRLVESRERIPNDPDYVELIKEDRLFEGASGNNGQAFRAVFRNMEWQSYRLENGDIEVDFTGVIDKALGYSRVRYSDVLFRFYFDNYREIDLYFAPDQEYRRVPHMMHSAFSDKGTMWRFTWRFDADSGTFRRVGAVAVLGEETREKLEKMPGYISSGNTGKGDKGLDMSSLAGRLSASDMPVVVKGTVSHKGKPVKDAGLYMPDLDAGTCELYGRTDKDGAFEFSCQQRVIDSGRCILAYHPDYAIEWYYYYGNEGTKVSFDLEKKHSLEYRLNSMNHVTLRNDIEIESIQRKPQRNKAFASPVLTLRGIKYLGGKESGRIHVSKLFDTMPSGAIVAVKAYPRGYETKSFELKEETSPLTVMFRPEGRIEGQVTYKADGKPVGNVKLMAIAKNPDMPTRRVETVSDSWGNFVFTNLSSGWYIVVQAEPRIDGIAKKVFDIEVLSRETTKDVSVELEEGVLINGEVVDAESGETVCPGKDAQVLVANETTNNNFFVPVLGDGTFLARSFPGKMKLALKTGSPWQPLELQDESNVLFSKCKELALKEGPDTGKVVFEVKKRNTVPDNQGQLPGAAIKSAADQPVMVKGTVRYKGMPVEKATIFLPEREKGRLMMYTTTGKDGSFAFTCSHERLENNSFLLANHQDYSFDWYSFPQDYDGGNIAFELEKRHALEFSVTDQHNVSLRDGISLDSIRCPDRRNGGEYTRSLNLKGLTHLDASVIKPVLLYGILGHMPSGSTATLTARPKGYETRTFTLSEKLNPRKIELRPEGRIKGKVTYADSGEPVENAKLATIFHYSRNRVQHSVTETDESGNYTFTNLPPGTYSVWLAEHRIDGVADGISNIEVKSRETTDGVDIQLKEGALIIGKVVDIDSGETVPPGDGAQISIHYPHAPELQFIKVPVLDDGTFAARVNPGVVRLNLKTTKPWLPHVPYKTVNKVSSEPKEFYLKEGETLDSVVFEARKGYMINGVVIKSPGEPAGAVTVESKFFKTETDRYGKFSSLVSGYLEGVDIKVKAYYLWDKDAVRTVEHEIGSGDLVIISLDDTNK